MLLLTIVFVIVSINQTFSECNVCGKASKSICLSRSEFQLCDGDKPINELGIFECPSGLVCVDDPLRCKSARTEIPSCGVDCRVCNPLTHVACINEFTFAFCFDEENLPSRLLGFCKNGKVCKADSSIICVDSETEKATCPDYTHTTTTSTTIPTTITSTTGKTSIPTLTPTVSTPDDMCQQYGKIGKFPIPGKCNSYIICMMSGNYLIGRQYNCWHDGVFDCKIRQCIINGDCDYSCSYDDKKF